MDSMWGGGHGIFLPLSRVATLKSSFYFSLLIWLLISLLRSGQAWLTVICQNTESNPLIPVTSLPIRKAVLLILLSKYTQQYLSYETRWAHTVFSSFQALLCFFCSLSKPQPLIIQLLLVHMYVSRHISAAYWAIYRILWKLREGIVLDTYNPPKLKSKLTHMTPPQIKSRLHKVCHKQNDRYTNFKFSSWKVFFTGQTAKRYQPFKDDLIVSPQTVSTKRERQATELTLQSQGSPNTKWISARCKRKDRKLFLWT